MLLTGFYSQLIKFDIQMGSDRSRTSGDTAPYDDRAGFRLNDSGGTTGIIQDGISPAGGGAIVTWGNDGNPIIPPGYTNADFEYKWEDISGSPSVKNSPVAVSTFDDWDATKTWFAQQTSGPSGLISWVIDITLREKADTANTDTMRMTMTVEAI